MKKILSVLCGAMLFPALLLGPCLSIPAAAEDKVEIDAVIDSIPADWPQAPEISAPSAVLLDADSGEILYAKNATEAMYPASTTKLMTALLTLENASLSDIVSFSSRAVAIPSGSSHIGMRRNEQMVLRECLYGLLLPSANEVANALAEHVSGTIKTFVVLMNERAYQLGAVNTVFRNVNGLHEDGHVTCAYDLALIMRACIENNTFVEIASTPSYVHHADELLPKDIPMTNTHMMIRSSSEYYNEYAVCGKTGHTDESGYNLVTYAEKDGIHLISVVMGCESGGQYTSTQALLDYGFNYFRMVLPAELDISLDMEAAFTDSPLALPVPEISLLKLDSESSILLPADITFDMLTRDITSSDDAKFVTYSYEGYPLGSVKLISADTAEDSPIFEKKAEEALSEETVPDLLVIDGWLLVGIAVLFLLFAGFTALLRSWTMPKYKMRLK